MNIRITPDQIRLRLSLTDFNLLREKGALKEVIELNALEKLEYELTVWHLSIPEVSFLTGKIKVSIPQSMLETLKMAANFSVSGTQQNHLGQSIRIVVEKDMHALREG